MILSPAGRLHDQHGLITRRQALAAGNTDRELRRLLRSGSWLTLRHGVYVEAEHWQSLDPYREQPLLRIRAARLTLGGDYVLSHDSAAIVLGLGAPDPVHALVHVTRRKVHGDADRAGVKHHLAPYSPDQVLLVDGLPVLDHARTALDMAREHGLVAGVAVGDQVLRRGVPRADLRAARAAMWCWPGSRTMDAALELLDDGAESWLESEARVLVTGLGIGRPQTQLGLSDGHRTVWCDLRVGRHVFEVDGFVKYADDNLTGESPRRVLELEKQRQDFVTGFKLGVSRITAHDCRAGRRAAEARLLREFRDTCARFGTDLGDLTPYVVQRPRRPR